MATVAELQAQVTALTDVSTTLNASYQSAKSALLSAQQSGISSNVAQAQASLDQILSQLNQTNVNLIQAKNQLVSAQANESVTTPSASQQASLNKYRDAGVVGNTGINNFINQAGTVAAAAYLAKDQFQAVASAGKSIINSLKGRSVAGVPPGAMSTDVNPSKVNINTNGTPLVQKDNRVRIRVPQNYLTSLTYGIQIADKSDSLIFTLEELGGIIFPYTPTISQDYSAEYASANPTHSNYSIYFYKNSKVGAINITGKFTVQNEADANVYLATIHLLRALTKMRSGGSTGDRDSGSPPPVCRLQAYGEFMFDNTPVAITNFRIELPDSVDYFTAGKPGFGGGSIYGQTSVPVVSTIALTCIPIYSRAEMQKFSVSSWLNKGITRARKGYL